MKIIAFLVVGSFNTLLGIAIYGILLRLGASFPLASGVSLAIGIVVGFHAHRHLVFRRRGLFLRYLMVWLAIYGLANFLIWILQGRIGAFLAGVATTPINAAVAFLAMRHLVFRDSNPDKPVP